MIVPKKLAEKPKQKNSTLDLRSSVQLSQFALSVPDFFWSAADALQGLYNRVRQYLEIDERAEVLSTRFDAMQGVLELARQTQEARHMERLGEFFFFSFFLLRFLRLRCFLCSLKPKPLPTQNTKTSIKIAL